MPRNGIQFDRHDDIFNSSGTRDRMKAKKVILKIYINLAIVSKIDRRYIKVFEPFQAY